MTLTGNAGEACLTHTRILGEAALKPSSIVATTAAVGVSRFGNRSQLSMAMSRPCSCWSGKAFGRSARISARLRLYGTTAATG